MKGTSPSDFQETDREIVYVPREKIERLDYLIGLAAAECWELWLGDSYYEGEFVLRRVRFAFRREVLRNRTARRGQDGRDTVKGTARNPRRSRVSRRLSARKSLEVFARDDYRCVTCGTREDLTVDHIHPVSKGGTNDMENLRTLCRSCNSRKGAKLVGGDAE